MIWQALRQKFRDRGPVGFLTDAIELSAACAIAGATSFAIAGAALVGGILAAPALALDLLTGPRHHCDANCAAHRTSCRNTEESGS